MLDLADEDVLIVEDNVSLAMLHASQLGAKGITSRSVHSGSEALELLHQQVYRVVLLDLNLPDMDGFEVLRQMKADPSLCDIPVIVVSGMDDKASFEQCLEIGAVDYVTKPFDLAQLKSCVDSHLGAE